MVCDKIPLDSNTARGDDDDDDVCYYIGERLQLEGETENRGV